MRVLRQEEEAKSKEESAARNRRQMVFRGGGSANSSLMALKDSAESSDSSVGSAGLSVDNGQQQQPQQHPPHHGLSNKHHRIVKRAILAAQLSLDSQERSRQHSGEKSRGRRAAPPASVGGLTLPPPSTSLSTGSLLQQPLSRSPSTSRPNSAALQGERALRRANTIHKQPSVFGGGVSGSCGDVNAQQQVNFKLPLFKVCFYAIS